MAQCKATTKGGQPCQATPRASGWCFSHDPALGAKRAEARKRGGHNRRRPKAKRPQGESAWQPLRSVKDVLALLEGVANDLAVMENSIQRARALGYVAGVALKALEVGEIEARLEALEQRLEEQKREQGTRWAS